MVEIKDVNNDSFAIANVEKVIDHRSEKSKDL